MMNQVQALAQLTAAVPYFPEPYKSTLKEAVDYFSRVSSTLQESTVEELFAELRRRHVSCLFAASRPDGFMVKLHGGPVYDCVGLAEVAKDMLKAQMQIIPFNDGAPGGVSFE